MKKRIIIAPFIFIAYTFLIVGGLIFPTTAVIMFSFIQLIACPFIDLLSWATGEKIKTDLTDSCVKATNNKYLNCLLGITPLVWFSSYMTYNYIRTGELPFINDKPQYLNYNK